jgi:hypothetical protein
VRERSGSNLDFPSLPSHCFDTLPCMYDTRVYSQSPLSNPYLTFASRSLTLSLTPVADPSALSSIV